MIPGSPSSPCITLIFTTLLLPSLTEFQQRLYAQLPLTSEFMETTQPYASEKGRNFLSSMFWLLRV